MAEVPVRIGRRAVLAAGFAGLGGLMARTLAARAAGGPVPLAADGLVIRNYRPLDAEAPIAALRSFLTPPDLFFVRSHFGPPDENPAGWTLTVDGSVRRPLTLTLDAIRALGSVSRVVTSECAGNGRGLYRLANTGGVQWEYGAVSTAEWTGVPLAVVLDRAGLAPDCRHLWMRARDHAPLPAVPTFLRSIPREVGLGDVLLAFEMNHRPIPLLHGGPLRLIAPGWFGMASTKWLEHIHARPDPSDNFFMATGYRFAPGNPVERMRVKSLITSPLAGERVPVGRTRVTGQAWSGLGAGGIRGVDVSLDDGRTWRPARLTGPETPYAWRRWEAEVHTDAPGPHRLRARATDRSGATQPVAAEPNPGGYGNNSMHEVGFDAIQA